MVEKQGTAGAGFDPAHPYPQRAGIIDTLDSIVVAFILAFVFRAFVVEAFVIPTGSMAPTLYGAHGMIACPKCGTEFAYGLQDRAAKGGVPVGANDEAICPNCDHVIATLSQNDYAGNADAGDRILVLKWPYDAQLERLGPQRWDVTVFKNPSDGNMNYIKRLAGLPNEVLMIVDGDVYTAPVETLSAGARAAFEAQLKDKYELQAGLRYGVLQPLPEGVLAELDGKLRITRKTPVAQKSLWFVVYDHNYLPRAAGDLQPRWEAQRGADSRWDTRQRRVRFDGRGGATEYIELRDKAMDARCAYNIRSGSAPPVSDQRVRFVLLPVDGEGVVRLRLEKRGRVFWATLHMSGLVTLCESAEVPAETVEPPLVRQLAPFRAGRPVEIAFENVDYRVALAVRGQEVLATSSEAEAPGYYAPDVRALRQGRLAPAVTPRIYAEGGVFELMHLVVERDVYYYWERGATIPDTWARTGPWGGTGNPILLRADEYFMLGDNTAASQDSRLWFQVGAHLVDRREAYQLGTVPRDQLIGKAFFVYWPSGHRLSWLPPPLRNVGFIPDVGRMRWIR
ncbi:MAG TPA: S26 family signal peptidase [Phycisphaerae bacterium]|nr:S26 family signal peptidase [Phycisphaerae bacterium]HNU47043.1 S26 family signal peptidase [Phycisphaerae bacterium]